MDVIRRHDGTTIRALAYWGPLAALLWEDYLRDALGRDTLMSALIDKHMNHRPSSVGMLQSGLGIHKIVCTRCDLILYEEDNLETS